VSVAQLYAEVSTALARAFSGQRQIWVRGEVQELSEPRSGHCYLSLVDPDSGHDPQAAVLRVSCWKTRWGPLKRTLGREGIVLQQGMVITLGGRLELYRPRGSLNFIAQDLDVTDLVGRLAAHRAALLRRLEDEGLLTRNRAVILVPVPIRVGLVASPGSDGYRDFMGQLGSSGFSFDVRVAAVQVQGPDAPASIARGICQMEAAGDRDVVVVVRGGGAKADLAAFDDERVARAIATSALPVWTGIGHTGDQSVADMVAHRACTTPTACGRELALTVTAWWEASVASPASIVWRRSTEVLADAQRRDHVVRGRLAASARQRVERGHERLRQQARSVLRCAPAAVDDAHDASRRTARRVGPLAHAHVHRQSDRLGHWRRLIAAYDVDRQLERGYTLTIDSDGRPIRSATDVTVGEMLRTRFADGAIRSVVEEVELRVAGRGSP